MEKLPLEGLDFRSIGRAAALVALSMGTSFEGAFTEAATTSGLVVVKGRVGSMELAKVVAAIETACHREGMLSDEYRHEHALYHATIEALHGVCRGQLTLGSLLRTAGLVFVVVRSVPREGSDASGWLAVCMYGNIGAPRVGWEHEALGLGISHV